MRNTKRGRQSEAVRDAIVIGLGRIGSLNDAGWVASGREAAPRSHIGAIAVTEGLRLVAAVDPSAEARDRARQQWQWDGTVTTAESVEGLSGLRPAVVAVCTPTATRYDMVRAALSLRPEVLLIEKPLASDLAEAEALHALVLASGVEARVVFHRRFDPGHVHFKAQLPAEAPLMVVMRYGKGLHNYGSHLLDLLLDWFGTVLAVQALGEASASPDPALSFRCRMAAGFDAVLLGMEGASYDQFDIDLFYSDRVLTLRNGGVEKLLSLPVEHLYYPGYAHLGGVQAVSPVQSVTGFAELYAGIARWLDDKTPLAGCTVAEALHGQRVLDAALRSSRAGGAVVSVPIV